MKPQKDRRSGTDRRQQEMGFPGTQDRRRRIEQRKVELVELTISEAEWQLLFCAAQAAPANAPYHSLEDAAALVFERASGYSGR